MARPRWTPTPEDDHLIKTRYRLGDSARSIGKKIGVDGALITRRLRELKIPIRQSWTRKGAANDRLYAFDDRREELINRYSYGRESVEALASELGVATSTMSKILTRFGVELRRRGPRVAADFRDGEIRCSRCRKWKPESEYHADQKASNGRMHHCMACSRAAQLKRMYNIEVADYDRMLEAQNGCCAICGCEAGDVRNRSGGRSRAFFCVDHDHTTNAIRGLLCHCCNIGLGHFADSVNNLIAAQRYLTKEPRP